MPRDLNLTLVKSDVRTTDCGRVTIQNVGGDVLVQQARGEVTARVIRGDLRIADVPGDVSATTKRGDVTVRASSTGRLEISTVRGDIDVRVGAFAPGGDARIHTVNGDVSLHLGPQARCRIEAMTVAGDVSSVLPLQDVRADPRRLAGTLGAPDATVRISATRGDISLRTLQTEAAAAQAPPA